MEKASHIKPKPRILDKLTGNFAVTFSPIILFPEETYKDLVSENPTIQSQALLAHEETHLQRQADMGTSMVVKMGI